MTAHSGQHLCGKGLGCDHASIADAYRSRSCIQRASISSFLSSASVSLSASEASSLYSLPESLVSTSLPEQAPPLGMRALKSRRLVSTDTVSARGTWDSNTRTALVMPDGSQQDCEGAVQVCMADSKDSRKQKADARDVLQLINHHNNGVPEPHPPLGLQTAGQVAGYIIVVHAVQVGRLRRIRVCRRTIRRKDRR